MRASADRSVVRAGAKIGAASTGAASTGAFVGFLFCGGASSATIGGRLADAPRVMAARISGVATPTGSAAVDAPRLATPWEMDAAATGLSLYAEACGWRPACMPAALITALDTASLALRCGEVKGTDGKR